MAWRRGIVLRIQGIGKCGCSRLSIEAGYGHSGQEESGKAQHLGHPRFHGTSVVITKFSGLVIAASSSLCRRRPASTAEIDPDLRRDDEAGDIANF